MATILLAIGDGSLREACRAQLAAAGQAVLVLDRPLAPLTLARKVAWDAVLVDATPLGRQTLRTLTDGPQAQAAVVGLGLKADGLAASLPLPLAGEAMIATVVPLLTPVAPAETVLSLDRGRRMALADGREVALTRIEFRLLEVLLQHQPREASLPEVLSAVWGFTEGRGTSELVRAHVRNLRLKLNQLGLPDAIRSRRGRGYALVV